MWMWKVEDKISLDTKGVLGSNIRNDRNAPLTVFVRVDRRVRRQCY
jgi:hypothetical protein